MLEGQSDLDLAVLDDSSRGCAGVDEVGRGPLAGPVYAAAVILPADVQFEGLNDSKMVSAKARDRLDLEIRAGATAWAIGCASVAEVDQYNVLRASHLAMQRAVAGLRTAPRLVFVDGNQPPKLGLPVIALPGGDRHVAAISAASIIAKVARDRAMIRLDQRFPGYGFAGHKGYASKAHLAALRELGACPEHRRSFAPVAAALESTHKVSQPDLGLQATNTLSTRTGAS